MLHHARYLSNPNRLRRSSRSSENGGNRESPHPYQSTVFHQGYGPELFRDPRSMAIGEEFFHLFFLPRVGRPETVAGAPVADDNLLWNAPEVKQLSTFVLWYVGRIHNRNLDTRA